ncbi:PIN domain-containing protein [Marinitenerispora sediminis]|uniref:PIN domain-containing protein n=1 Tax=Marinitenerispora sediminis TaxID=1931232 RepID=UPI001F3C43BD|nr:PIN domain-containing protein [Marinitenerispora sediminis]
MHALRGLVRAGKATVEQAEWVRKIDAAQVVADIPIDGPLADRVWELRHHLTAYDAAYVAVAEARECPLVTSDARLAVAPGVRCDIRLVR